MAVIYLRWGGSIANLCACSLCDNVKDDPQTVEDSGTFNSAGGWGKGGGGGRYRMPTAPEVLRECPCWRHGLFPSRALRKSDFHVLLCECVCVWGGGV